MVISNGLNIRSTGRVFALAMLAFAVVQAVRMGLFLAAGRGHLPLGLATGFSTIAIFGTALLILLITVLQSWVGHEPKPMLQVAALTIFVTILSFVANSLFPGVVLFRRAFEGEVRNSGFLAAVQPWADKKLNSSDDMHLEQSVRLKRSFIPEELRALRKPSEPYVTLMYGTKEARWVFVMAKWREGHSEWGLLFTPHGDNQFDTDKDLRRVAPRVYSFYH